MRIEVINTGSELLLGQVQNTHLAYIAHQLFPLGVAISRQCTVPDGPAIRDALIESFPRTDIIFVTGGLGPTTDDLTRDITAELLSLPLEHDAETENRIAARFQRRGIAMSARVLRQAQKPHGSTLLPNEFGTAPGIYIPPQQISSEDSSSLSPHLFLLPGPPRELYPMMENTVLPILQSILPQSVTHKTKTWHLIGIPESTLEEAVGASLIAQGIEPGYCARLGEVDVRVTGSEDQINAAEHILKSAFPDALLPDDAPPLDQWIVETLTKENATVSTAESCTGGLIAHRITQIPGASKVFIGSHITYANSEKVSLGVPQSLIETHGAVSEPVASLMAQSIRNRTGSTYGIATTGIAGPDGGTPSKPVGTVWISISGPNDFLLTQSFLLKTDRSSFKQLASQNAIDMLRKHLQKKALHNENP